MNNYQVNFEPKSRKVISIGFNISASSIEDAERQATRLMIQIGESLTQFKRPKVRVIDESLAA